MKKMLFAINVGWYFDLHWQNRMKSQMTQSYDVHLCMSKATSLLENLDEIKLKRSSTNFFNNIKSFIQMHKVFCKIKPDFIHSVTVKPNLMFGVIALIYRKPILITIPGLGSMFSQSGVGNKLAMAVIVTLYRLISYNKKAIYVFENKSDLNFFIKQKICHISNGFTVPGSGVNIQEYNALPINISSTEELKLLFAARLLKGKGLYELVKAVSNLQKKGIKVTLNVAGIIDDDSIEAIPIGELESWHKNGKINWLGQIDSDMASVIEKNDVVVLPTRYGEGLPRILIEANACRRPVITTDVGGCKEFVNHGENGILIGAEDFKALEHAIVRFTDRPYIAKLGEAGRNRVEKFYTDQHVIASYQKIYSKLFT